MTAINAPVSRSTSRIRGTNGNARTIWIGTLAFWIVVAGLIAARIALLDTGSTAPGALFSQAPAAQSAQMSAVR